MLQVEKMASIFLPLSDIAVIIGVPVHELRSDVSDPQSDVGLAYRRGKAASKVKIHQQEMALALVGSPLALQNVQSSLISMEDDE